MNWNFVQGIQDYDQTMWLSGHSYFYWDMFGFSHFPVNLGLSKKSTSNFTWFIIVVATQMTIWKYTGIQPFQTYIHPCMQLHTHILPEINRPARFHNFPGCITLSRCCWNSKTVPESFCERATRPRWWETLLKLRCIPFTKSYRSFCVILYVYIYIFSLFIYFIFFITVFMDIHMKLYIYMLKNI
jgi:hypothetical protein